MSKSEIKKVSFKKSEGELYVKVTDRFFNKIYERTVGLKDRKGLASVFSDLRNKGIDINFTEKELLQEWW